MKRWGVCKMTYDPVNQENVSAISKYDNVAWRIFHTTGRNWVLIQFAAADLTEIQADPDIYVMPEGVMDMSVGSIPANVRNTMRTRLEAAGFVFTDVKTTWTIRQLLNYLGGQIFANFNCEAGDVRDVV